MRGLLITSTSIVQKKISLLVVLNWLFFGGIVVGTLLEQAGYLKVYRFPFIEDFSATELSNMAFMVLSIFVFNLVLSGFLLSTLTGLVFFILPVGFLLFRALLWGALVNSLPTPLFLASFATLILEGEGYVLAGLAGVNLGLSWLKPELAIKGGKLSRSEAVKQTFKDCLRIYVLVALFLLAGAVVETITLAFI